MYFSSVLRRVISSNLLSRVLEARDPVQLRFYQVSTLKSSEDPIHLSRRLTTPYNTTHFTTQHNTIQHNTLYNTINTALTTLYTRIIRRPDILSRRLNADAQQYTTLCAT